jgi:hypothetical protein
MTSALTVVEPVMMWGAGEEVMGFDVDVFVPDGGSASSNPVLKKAFQDAVEWLLENAGGRDGFLHLGSLD